MRWVGSRARYAVLLAGIAGVVALGVWGWMARGLGMGPSAGFLGWLGMVTVLGTVGVIGWTAVGRGAGGGGKEVMLGYAVLGDVLGIVVAGVGMGWAGLGWREVAAIYFLLAAWGAMWCAVGWVLRRWGRGVSIGVPLVLAMFFLASPVVMMPVVRSAAHWESAAERELEGRAGEGEAISAWQGRVMAAIGVMCPVLAEADAVGGRVAGLPGMAGWSDLPEGSARRLPRWWVNGVVYAGVAGLVWAGGRPRGRGG